MMVHAQWRCYDDCENIVGETRSKKLKNRLGQGTFGAALVSTLYIKWRHLYCHY